MTIRVIVNGAFGRMGQLIVKTLSTQSEITLVGETGRGHDLTKEIKNTQANVVIDFTNAESVFQNALTIIEAGAHPVIGTTGMTEKEITQLQQRCEELKLGGAVIPNFSIGAVLIMKYARDMVQYYPEVEIIEMHHNNKLDSPSGTAVKTAEMLAKARKVEPPVKIIHETIPGARGANYLRIPIHAVRLPGLVAHLQILFGGNGETVTLRHDSVDRVSFMPGVILACKKVTKLDKLVYGLEYLLD